VSTKPWRRNGIAAAASLASAGVLAACAGPAPEPGHSFDEVRFARVAPPPAPAYLTPPQAVASAPVTPAEAPAGALARVQALLAEDGFKVETRTEGAEDVIAATRMSTPEALRDEAACPLEAMRRPDFSATDLDVRLGPATGVRTVSRFVLVDTNLISGDLTRQTCRSNGALEAAVRRAAAR
jgi:hypothetical protein